MKRIVYTSFFLISSTLLGQEITAHKVVSDTAVYLVELLKNPSSEVIALNVFVPGLKFGTGIESGNNQSDEILLASNKVYVRKPMAVSISFVQEALNRRDFGLKVFAAYEPYTILLERAALLKNTKGEELLKDCQKHSRAASVDVSLISLTTGEEIQMPTAYFQHTAAASADYKTLPTNVIENRDLLITVMQQHGFRVSPDHWWHFDFMGWQGFDRMDLSFDEFNQINTE